MIKMSKDKGKDLIQEKAEILRKPTPAAGLSQDKVKINLQVERFQRILMVIY